MSPQGYGLNEDSYLEAIGKVIKRLKLRNTIVCGASMAGHVSLAAAIKSKDLNIHGSIPCEGCDHLAFTQPIYEIKGSDVSLLDPERVCGMCSPSSPEYFKKQIWWQYSSQGLGIFSGDLKFYFRGWDGRGRVEKIDTDHCPVYMLTGEYDYSCTTEASKATADKIPNAVFEAMPGLGHFPLTENPSKVLPYLMRALDHIQKARR
jgi:pimeloyl-ACP methyl ester carboxylesterase